MKHILKHEFGFFSRRLLQIDPKKQIRVRQQCRHQKHFDVLAVQTSLRCKHERPNHLSHLSHSLLRVKLARMLSRTWVLASMFGLSNSIARGCPKSLAEGKLCRNLRRNLCRIGHFSTKLATKFRNRSFWD